MHVCACVSVRSDLRTTEAKVMKLSEHKIHHGETIDKSETIYRYSNVGKKFAYILHQYVFIYIERLA